MVQHDPPSPKTQTRRIWSPVPHRSRNPAHPSNEEPRTGQSRNNAAEGGVLMNKPSDKLASLLTEITKPSAATAWVTSDHVTKICDRWRSEWEAEELKTNVND